LIRYTIHSDIDQKKWDQCIEQSLNPVPYSMSWWLNTVNPGWDALIEDEYQAVMPLTHKRKLGIHYLYQPFFSQQLGIFSSRVISASKTVAFLNAIPPKFRYIDIQLNRLNDPFESGFRCRLRNNYLLDLSDSYGELLSRYNRSCRRNVVKASHHHLKLKTGPGPVVFTRFIERNLDMKLQGKNKAIYPLLEKICSTSLQQDKAEILGVYDAEGELIASQWYVQHMQRIVLLACASTEKGRKTHAMYFLIDQIIRKKAGTETILDFSGSDIPGVAYFNAGFGAIKSSYPAVIRNTLWGMVRRIKN
jgi:hypothetical protein